MGESISKTITLCGGGEVVLEKSVQAKRLSISVRPFKGARVAVPRTVSFDRAARFAASKTAWLKKQNIRMAAREQEAIRLLYAFPIRRNMARRRIVARLEHLSELSGLGYNKVFIRNQKTRWGSCSCRNNINLNLNLVRLPEELMDYVILHELVHTRIKNHGPNFWTALAAHIDTPKRHDRALNQYGALLAARDSVLNHDLFLEQAAGDPVGGRTGGCIR